MLGTYALFLNDIDFSNIYARHRHIRVCVRICNTQIKWENRIMPKSVAIRPNFGVAIALRCSYNLIVLLYTIASETLQSNLNVYNSTPPNLISLKRCAFAFRLCILPRDRTKRTRGILKWYCGRCWPRGWWCVATVRIGCGEIRPLLLMSEWWCSSESCRNRTYAEAAALPPNAAFSDKVILSVRNASQRHTNTEAHNKTQIHRKLFRASITWCLACHQACWLPIFVFRQ